MTTLLTFRDSVKSFYGRYDYIITPILKFCLAVMVFLSINGQTGYVERFDNILLVLGLSVVCAFLPVEFIAGIGFVIFLLQTAGAALDAAFVAIALVLIFYCGYMRFAPKTGIILFLVPMCYTGHLVYALPILLGFLVGPLAVIPAIFGILFCYYEESLAELVNMLAASVEEETIQGYQYILTSLMENKQMQLMFFVFACVIMVTYLVYRASFSYSWLVAFCVGGFLNIVLFLVGSVTLSVEVEIGSILLGSIVGILIAACIQFGKGIVDFQRTELLQFEDDEYYYYVKAIPKLSVAESNKNVKHINSKMY